MPFKNSILLLFFVLTTVGCIKSKGQIRSSCVESTSMYDIDFSLKEFQGCISAVTGLSDKEKMGRWSNAPLVLFQYKSPLPKNFSLDIDGFVFVGATKQEIEVTVGNQKRYIYFEDNTTKTYHLNFSDVVQGENSILFYFPKVVSPQSIGMSEDIRRLGFFYKKITIRSI